MTNDVVLTYADSPVTCGTVRFSQQLAERLGVPCLPIGRYHGYDYPLFSIQPATHAAFQNEWRDDARFYPHYAVFLHSSGTVHDSHAIMEARRVYCANAVIARDITCPTRLWCPSTIQARPPRGGVRILTFGMAQKVQWAYHEQLKAVLDASVLDYSVNLSCAVHEGAPWEQTVGESWQKLQAIYGDHARLLGYLADDALVDEMRRSAAVAAFFPGGVRANNTTAWAALERGIPLVTNLDADSPPELQHEVSVLDIAKLTDWPNPSTLREVRHGAKRAAAVYSWERLLDVLKPQPVTA